MFSPSNINASMNDIVSFVFESQSPVAHTATQTGYTANGGNPCSPLASSSSSGAGKPFDTGFVSVPSGQTPTFNITISDPTLPIYGACQQVGHCQLGMVFAINAPSSGSGDFDNFLAAATGKSVSPSSSSSSGSSSSSSSSSSKPSSTPSNCGPYGGSCGGGSGNSGSSSGASTTVAKMGTVLFGILGGLLF